MINVFQPSLGEEELDALRGVFADSRLGHGPRSRAFEAEFAAHLGVDPEHVVFLESANAGLVLAGELLELGPGDDVVLPSISFVAVADAIRATGARPVFCDVDEHTLNPTAADVERALTPDTAAVVLLHYGGYPGHVETIAQLLRERGIALVEDAACAVASTANGRAAGTFGDLAVWSFDATKLLVTGDGGMLYVRDAAAARRARRLAHHGAGTGGDVVDLRVSRRSWELDVRDLGRRVTGTDMTAALGSVQLRRLPEFVERRAAVVERYDALLAGVSGVRRPPRLPRGHTTSHHFYWVQLEPELRDGAAADLREQAVHTTLRHPRLHRVPAYGEAGGELPATDRAAESTLLLPVHQQVSSADVERVVTVLRDSVARQGVRQVA